MGTKHVESQVNWTPPKAAKITGVHHPRMQKASATWQNCWTDIIGASPLAWFIVSKTM